METSYLLPYLFSAADCGGEMRVVRESDENASGSRTGSEGGPLLPGGHHQGNWIRHFSNPTPKNTRIDVRPVAPKPYFHP